jgi:beta-aspartyl-peptidase (threonine type)
MPPRWALAIHGGAGVICGDDPEKVAASLEGLSAALRAGAAVLKAGGAALDAVEAAVVALEDDPHFNAGHGSVLNAEGDCELEASVMTGDGRAGAAALLRTVKNPVRLARAVMEETPHVLLTGPPAEALAARRGHALVSNEALKTPDRVAQLRRQAAPPLTDELMRAEGGGGTVGAVALDASGGLAAATSTGGRSGKWAGRIGDTPIIGAGNYACRALAASGTGLGEQFQRHVVAHEIAARVVHGGTPLPAAVSAVLREVLSPGDGGVIAVGADGSLVMDFTSPGMWRGAADSDGRFEVAVFP